MPTDDERAAIRDGIGKIMVPAAPLHPKHKGKRVNSADAKRLEELMRDVKSRKASQGTAAGEAAKTVTPPAVLPGGGAAPTPVVTVAPVAAPTPTKLTDIGTKRWSVKKAKKVSLFGQMMTLPAGKIISEDGHGSAAIARLLEQGVELEEMK